MRADMHAYTTACGITARKYTFYNYILRCMTAQLVFFLRAATTPPHCTRTVYCEHAVKPEKALPV